MLSSQPPLTDRGLALTVLPRDADREALAQQWARQRPPLDHETRDRVMNAALGLPHWAREKDRSSAESRRCWTADERDARLELARRQLAELAELAECWQSESLGLDLATRYRIFNVALGLSEDDTGQRHVVVHQRSWLPDELEAEFELARRRLGITAAPWPRPARPRWQLWPRVLRRR